MWGGQRPGIITLSPVPHKLNKLPKRYSGASILPLLPSSPVPSHFYYPEVSWVQFVTFLFGNPFWFEKKRKTPPLPKEKHNISVKSSYPCSNAVQFSTCKCSLPSLWWCTLKHTSCLHSFKVLPEIIVFIELCISSFSGFSNSKLESNTQKIKVCKAFQSVFCSVSCIISIIGYSSKRPLAHIIKHPFAPVKTHRSGYLITGQENKRLQ